MKSNDDIVADCEKKLRTKTLIDFNNSVACGIKSAAVQKY